jgi:hypothetical protein
LDRTVLRDIVIRVPGTIGSDHPHCFAAERITESLEHPYLIGEAVHPLAPLGIGLHHRLAPGVSDHALQRHVLLHGIGAYTTWKVLLEKRERPDEGLLGGVVRAQCEGGKERWPPPTIVGAVGAAHDRLDMHAIEGTSGFPLFHEIAECGCTDDRKDHLVDHAGRVIQAGLCHAREPPGFPMHPFTACRRSS